MGTIKPRDIPDLNVVGQSTGKKEELWEREFVSHCPPDVQPRTRVIAACGVTDVGDDASPTASGFFLSDFYLLFHLLEPTREPSLILENGSQANPKRIDEFPNVTPSRQLWFTCEAPRALVEKYSVYAHGDFRKERRIVLEDTLLPKIEQSDRLRVVPRHVLLERFLATLREQSRIAFEQNEPLLVLLFGHGDAKTYGIQVGGEGDPDRGPRLLINHVKAAIRPGAQVTLVTTSCFSGGWLIHPTLNLTGIAAAKENRESLSWPQSPSVRRVSGSRVASAIVKTLMDRDGLVLSDEECQFPTYMKLSESIWDTLKQIDENAMDTGMVFSAQDDNWETEYRRRSGFPLLSYQNRWETLRILPRGEVDDSSPETALDPATSLANSRTGSLKRRMVRHLGQIYLNSFPGLDDAGPNVALHNSLHFLIKDYNTKHLYGPIIDKRFEQLLYRLDVMREADKMRQHMNVEFPSIFSIDLNEWEREHAASRDTVDRVSRMILNRNIFDQPMGLAGPAYLKPWRYLAISLVSSELSDQEIEVRLDGISTYKKNIISRIFNRDQEKDVVPLT
ncbi:hypothetical protein FQN51_002088 [Onygenales sp. PD_10]|nr:hypothetical protein FQN51_002088 [Onygenales sp. PD_10]